MAMSEARRALEEAVPDVRDAGEHDAVDGVRPQWVAAVDGTESAAAAMRVAAEHGLHVVPRGSGSKLDWGGPPREVDLVLDLSGANEVVEHAAGDLVVHAMAGTPLADVQRVVGAAGQMLAIDQPLPTATVGGVIATATSGPCRHLFGGVRDLLIGITVVRPDGAVTISGGKVVKNVAGYDLGKLYTGSFGSLGVITEAVFRLHPLAAEHRWIQVETDDPGAAAEAVDRIRHSQAMPTAVEVDRATPGGRIEVVAEIEGRPTATHERALELADAVGGSVLEHAPSWWGRYPFDPADGIGIRVGVEPKALAALLSVRPDIDVAVRGAAGIGVLHAGLPGDADPAAVADLVGMLRERCDYAVLTRSPRAIREKVDPWGPVAPGVMALMRRTKDQFDPEHRLAPGRFVGGI
ncbi:glycolate oxidase FAD binding subunit [Saccharopolyspora erythraea NRRL 2338]|uniref:FAD linked oxidase-like n=2 Tax=Saccharopolyspora erythraea TaxID=1836 RepID=A4FNB0_SACEN|nr:FAD-binding oxidoreductase [Saccharopolyspora erythraea]EQD87092.1 FAD-binding protein [Saccharopolyspora erythraea D]PFG99174.1 glycolate oxidase FAD binding subunit [Saccharopolyspora erythraea NRRL 2338]QRK89123.1 FAD-binding oxidoreductase [Saccharopolyspora erythraea]CAM05535.1 FAD linked oxidase-like [Saccharopolyspora erythraea NRRL 2338]